MISLLIKWKLRFGTQWNDFTTTYLFIFSIRTSSDPIWNYSLIRKLENDHKLFFPSWSIYFFKFHPTIFPAGLFLFWQIIQKASASKTFRVMSPFFTRRRLLDSPHKLFRKIVYLIFSFRKIWPIEIWRIRTPYSSKTKSGHPLIGQSWLEKRLIGKLL